jgi:AraC family L-rhamnose operon regulatory protein RhaS
MSAIFTMMANRRPVQVEVPENGIAIAESVHAPGFEMPARVESFHKILAVMNGRCSAHFEESETPHATVTAVSTLIVPAGRVHSLADETPTTVIVICISAGFVDALPSRARLWDDLPKARALVVDEFSTQKLIRLVRAGLFEQTATNPPEQRELSLCATTDRILLALARAQVFPSEATSLTRVHQLVPHVAARPFEEWSVDRAAEVVGLSARRFGELFREAKGQTFHQYLSELRIAYACRLMEGQDYSIVAASFASGFGDLSSFYRAFRRLRGTSPAQWLERRRS